MVDDWKRAFVEVVLTLVVVLQGLSGHYADTVSFSAGLVVCTADTVSATFGLAAGDSTEVIYNCSGTVQSLAIYDFLCPFSY